jgi:hypothetical protein
MALAPYIPHLAADDLDLIASFIARFKITALALESQHQRLAYTASQSLRYLRQRDTLRYYCQEQRTVRTVATVLLPVGRAELLEMIFVELENPFDVFVCEQVCRDRFDRICGSSKLGARVFRVVSDVTVVEMYQKDSWTSRRTLQRQSIRRKTTKASTLPKQPQAP